MALRDKMRGWVAPHLDEGERPDVVLIVLIRSWKRALLALALYAAPLAAVGALAGTAPILVLVLVAAVVGGIAGLVASTAGPRKMMLVRTDRSLMLLSLNPVTGRPREVLDRGPRDTAFRADPGFLLDRVMFGPYDLWVARRFRKDVRALSAPEAARR